MIQRVAAPSSEGTAGEVKKARPLAAGAGIAIVSPSSPAEPASVAAGIAELRRLGYVPLPGPALASEGYFAGSAAARREELRAALANPAAAALIALRGGYGASYLLDALPPLPDEPKCLIGFSDLTSLQIFLWQTARWVTIYGPMVAAGFAEGGSQPHGYHADSLRHAVSGERDRWELALSGECLRSGQASGRVLGGCLTMIQATIGTPWELDTRDAILLLEDRAMKPFQLDRALMHLHQAGKFKDVRGIVLGDFPGCDPPVPGSPSARDVCRRILGELRIPVVFGAPVGHTSRPMVTVPLGVRAALHAKGEGCLEILEPAVSA